jgi:hypothetical protein
MAHINHLAEGVRIMATRIIFTPKNDITAPELAKALDGYFNYTGNDLIEWVRELPKKVRQHLTVEYSIKAKTNEEGREKVSELFANDLNDGDTAIVYVKGNETKYVYREGWSPTEFTITSDGPGGGGGGPGAKTSGGSGGGKLGPDSYTHEMCPYCGRPREEKK